MGFMKTFHNYLHLVLNITRSFSSITLLEGDTITLSCTPSIMEVVLLWTHNGVDVLQNDEISFSPPLLNHNLMITNPKIGDSGIYTCRAAIEDTLIKQNITVNVTAGNVVCRCMVHILVLGDIENMRTIYHAH